MGTGCPGRSPAIPRGPRLPSGRNPLVGLRPGGRRGVGTGGLKGPGHPVRAGRGGEWRWKRPFAATPGRWPWRGMREGRWQAGGIEAQQACISACGAVSCRRTPGAGERVGRGGERGIGGGMRPEGAVGGGDAGARGWICRACPVRCRLAARTPIGRLCGRVGGVSRV